MDRIICFLLMVIFSWASSSDAAQEVLKKASFIPQWSPQAQFAGYYVAYEKGIYKKYHIDLTLLSGGPHRSSSDFLEKRKADFATLWLSTAIQQRSQGLKLINLNQIFQRSALMLVAKKSKGIYKPEDINGKKVGLWRGEFQIQPKAFFKKYHLNIKIVPQSYSVNLFLREGIDVASAMWYNEYHTILNSGLNPEDLTTFFLHEHGLNFPEDGIYTLEETFKKDPSLSCAFVKASLEGWRYAFSHPEETLDIVLIYMLRAGVPANKAHQRWMLNRVKELILPPDQQVSFGTLQPSDYARVGQELKETGFIQRIPDYKSFYMECGHDVEK